MYAIGCILVELVTGECVFQTHSTFEHLAMMERVLGPFPSFLTTDLAEEVRGYFRRGVLDFPHLCENQESVSAVLACQRLEKLFPDKPGYNELMELCANLMDYSPTKRRTASQALKHPFFFMPLE